MAAIHEDATGQSRASAIANLVVTTMRHHTGRGPTKAKTNLSEDCAVVILQDTLLVAERTLVDQGHGALVLDIRRKFQHAMREPLVEGVEKITGRTVAAFLSDNHLDPDIAVETFVFEDGRGPHEGGAWEAPADR
jgi:uncharacterized protein YbcI